MLVELNSRLSAQSNLCGDQRTLADIAVFPFVRQFAGADGMWFERQSIPHVIAWLGRHVASPLFEQAFARLNPWAAGDPPVRWPA